VVASSCRSGRLWGNQAVATPLGAQQKTNANVGAGTWNGAAFSL